MLNTLEPYFVDTQVKEAIKRRKLGNTPQENALEVRPELLFLFQSPIFKIGPSKLLSRMTKKSGEEHRQ